MKHLFVNKNGHAQMSRHTTKPTKWVGAQRRLRSAWASAQSDQSLRCSHEDVVLSYPLSAQRRLWSDWADAQADLSLRWAHSHFVVFSCRDSSRNTISTTAIEQSKEKLQGEDFHWITDNWAERAQNTTRGSLFTRQFEIASTRHPKSI